MASRYRNFIRLCQEWQVDATKEGRDLGAYIRQKVGKAFKQGESSVVDAAHCDRTYNALQNLNKDCYRKRYPRSVNTLGATGNTAEVCRVMVSTETIESLQKEEAGLFTRLKQRFSKES